MHFLTAHLSEKDISDLRRQIPRKDLVEAWRDIEDHAKYLAKRLMGKEAATPSRTWNLLSSARPDMILFLAVTARQQAVDQKIKNFLTKWRQVQQRLPLPEMTELLITPQLPEYPKIARDVFLLLLDGKLRSRTETLKFLKSFAPPPPPPPLPPRRKRGPKGATPAAVEIAPVKAEAGKGKRKGAAAPVAAPAPAPPAKAKPGAVVVAKAKTEPAKGKPAKRRAKPAVKHPRAKHPAAKHPAKTKKAAPKKAKGRKR